MKAPLQGGRRAIRVKRSPAGGFTVVELMAAASILMIILAVIFGITQQISSAWKNSSAKIEAFQGARGAFAAMSQQISQATLNTYYDYYASDGTRRTTNNSATFVPARYGRYSDLHFISGGWSAPSKRLATDQVTQALFFQAPMGFAEGDYAGMDSLLNACGYYVVYNDDNTRPKFLDDGTLPKNLPDRYRFRLMQFIQPSQQLAIFPYAPGSEKSWFKDPLASSTPPVRVLAENIIALVVLPKLSTAEDSGASSLAPQFEYDSRPVSPPPTVQAATDHQLPPVIEVIMVAIDEPSAQRICTGSSMPDFGLTGGVDGLFKNVADLNDKPDGTAGDLSKLTRALDAQKIVYRVFRSQLALRNSKWSTE